MAARKTGGAKKKTTPKKSTPKRKPVAKRKTPSKVVVEKRYRPGVSGIRADGNDSIPAPRAIKTRGRGVSIKTTEIVQSTYAPIEKSTADFTGFPEFISGIDDRSTLSLLMTLYLASPWVYSAVKRRQTSISSVRWFVSQVQPEGRPIRVKDSKRKTKLGRRLNKPNKYQTWIDLIELTVADLAMPGWCLWELMDAPDGELPGLWRHRPDQIEIIPNADHYWDGVTIYKSDGSTKELTPDKFILFRYWSPLNDHRPSSGLASSRNWATMEQWALVWNRSFFERGAAGMPEGVFEAEGRLNEADEERLAERIRERVGHPHVWRDILILWGGLKYRKTGVTQQEMQFAELMKQAAFALLATLETPPAVVGLVDGMPLGTIREQKHWYYAGTILPQMKKIAEVINRWLAPDDEEFSFDRGDILSLVEDLEVQSRYMESLVTKGIMKINEARSDIGLEPVPWGDTYHMPLGLAAWDAQARPERPEGLQDTGTASHEFEQKSIPPDIQAKIDLWKAENNVLRNGLEAKFDKAYRKAFGELKNILLRRLRDEMGVVKLTKDQIVDSRKAEGFQMPPDFEFIRDEDLLLFEKYIRDLFLSSMNESARRAASAFGVSFKRLTEESPAWREAWDSWVENRAPSTLNTINERLQQAISRFSEEGRTPTDAVKGIENELDQVLSERLDDLKVSDTTTVINSGVVSQAEPVHTHKQWLNKGDGAVRNRPGGESHIEVARRNNGIVRIDEDFVLRSRRGQDRMSGPGDPRGSAENVSGCRCLLNLLTADEAEALGAA